MESALSVGLGSSSSVFHLKIPSLTPTHFPKPSLKIPPPPQFSTRSFATSSKPLLQIRVRASSNGVSPDNPIMHKLKTTAAAIVLAAFAAGVAGKLKQLPARAQTPTAETEEQITGEKVQHQQQQVEEEKSQDPSSPLSQFLESNSDAVEALKSLLQQKLEGGEDEEALKVLKKMVLVQPENAEWKFLMARVLNEMGHNREALRVFEEILKLNPLSFEALFETALLMDRCGEGNAALERLKVALKIAEEQGKVKETRDVRMIMAQIHFLQKNVDEALRSYEELAKEDPNDFRPYFCKGMIYSLLDKNKEAREEFAKYRKLSPKKFEVEGFLQTPLSRMKLFGTNEEN